MKKNLSLILLLFTALLSSCTLKEVINPDGSINTSAGINGNANTNSGAVTGYTGSVPNTYQPVTKGSVWTYKYDILGDQSLSFNITMTGVTNVFNGKTYYAAKSNNPQSDGSLGYFYPSDHVYSTRGSTISAGVIVDMLYLDDRMTLTDSVITTVNDAGVVNGAAGRFITKTIEKGVSKTVNGKTYNDVIHTRVDLQYDYGFGFQSFGIYDYYLAKGIGLIQLDFSSLGISISSETLTGYNIK